MKLVLILFLAISFVFQTQVAFCISDVYVVASSSSNGTTCGSSLLPCSNMKDALNNVDDGGVLRVLAGSFEVCNLWSNKSLSIIGESGAKFGCSALNTTISSYMLHFAGNGVNSSLNISEIVLADVVADGWLDASLFIEDYAFVSLSTFSITNFNASIAVDISDCEECDFSGVSAIDNTIASDALLEINCDSSKFENFLAERNYGMVLDVIAVEIISMKSFILRQNVDFDTYYIFVFNDAENIEIQDGMVSENVAFDDSRLILIKKAWFSYVRNVTFDTNHGFQVLLYLYHLDFFPPGDFDVTYTVDGCEFMNNTSGGVTTYALYAQMRKFEIFDSFFYGKNSSDLSQSSDSNEELWSYFLFSSSQKSRIQNVVFENAATKPRKAALGVDFIDPWFPVTPGHEASIDGCRFDRISSGKAVEFILSDYAKTTVMLYRNSFLNSGGIEVNMIQPTFNISFIENVFHKDSTSKIEVFDTNGVPITYSGILFYVVERNKAFRTFYLTFLDNSFSGMVNEYSSGGAIRYLSEGLQVSLNKIETASLSVKLSMKRDKIVNCYSQRSGGAISFFLPNRIESFEGGFDSVVAQDNEAALKGGFLHLSSLSPIPSTVDVKNCSFSGNHAHMDGGAVCINHRPFDGSASENTFIANFVDTLFQSNEANMWAGSISAYGTGIYVLLDNCSFVNNSATIVAVCLFSGPSVTQRANSWTFVAGEEVSTIQIRMDDGTISKAKTTNENVLGDGFASCPEGYILTSRENEVSCDICLPGTYQLLQSTSLAPLRCIVCPNVTTCSGGTSVVSNGNFFVYGGTNNDVYNETSVEVKTAPCYEGYCCSSLEDCEKNACANNRDGFVCAECESGYCHTFSPECIECSKCSTWRFVFANLFFAGIEVFFTVISSEEKSDGLWKVLAYFFQALPFCVQNIFKLFSSNTTALNAIVPTIVTLSSFQILGTYCPVKGISNTGIVWLQLFSPLFVITAFLFVVFLAPLVIVPSIILRIVRDWYRWFSGGGEGSKKSLHEHEISEGMSDDAQFGVELPSIPKRLASSKSFSSILSPSSSSSPSSPISEKSKSVHSKVTAATKWGFSMFSTLQSSSIFNILSRYRNIVGDRFVVARLNGSAVILGLVIYRGLLTSSFSLLDCRNYDIPQADGNDSRELRLFLAANEKCYNWWQVILWVFVVGILVPFPLFVLGVQFFILAKSRCFSLIDKHVVAKNDVDDVDVDEVKDNEEEEENENESIIVERDDVDDVDTTTTPTIPSITSISKSERVILGVLRSSYRHPFKWWESVQMGRRLVLIFCATVFHGAYSRALAILVANILILTIHIAASPFRIKSVNRLETISLLVLTVLSANSVKTAVLEQIGASQNDENIGDSVWTTILEVSLITLVCLIFGIIFGFDLVVNTIVPLVKNIVSNVNNLIRISRNNSSGDDDQNSQEEMMNVDSSCCVGDDNDDNERESMMSESLDEQIIEGELFVKDSEE